MQFDRIKRIDAALFSRRLCTSGFIAALSSAKFYADRFQRDFDDTLRRAETYSGGINKMHKRVMYYRNIPCR